MKILKVVDLVEFKRYLIKGGESGGLECAINKLQKRKYIMSDVEIGEFVKWLYMADVKKLLSLAIEYIVSYVYDYKVNPNHKNKEWDFMVGERKLDLKVAWFRKCPDEEKEIEYELRPLDILVDFRENEFQLLERVVRDFNKENIERIAKRFNELMHYELGLEYDIIGNEKSLRYW
jgi:hypothetical protein